MLRDFKAFLMRGNVLDLAVAVIIGAAFNKIVASLTEDVIMPVVGRIFGGLDFSSYFVRLGPIPASYHGSPDDYAALKKAGVSLFGYGEFVTQVVNFLIVAFIIFLLVVRGVNRAIDALEHDASAPASSPNLAAEPAPEPAPEPADVALLREIRDELRKRPATG